MSEQRERKLLGIGRTGVSWEIASNVGLMIFKELNIIFMVALDYIRSVEIYKKNIFFR